MKVSFFLIALTLLLTVPPMLSAAAESAPAECSLRDYLAAGGQTWFLTGKLEYGVEGMMVSKEISFRNDFEVADYTVGDDGVSVVIRGVVGEMYVSSLPKVIASYTLADGSAIGEDTFAEKDVYVRLKSKAVPDAYMAMYVPLDTTVSVETSWGTALHTNLPNAPHGRGDFLVCRVTEDGQPDLSDIWVVTGALFPVLYDLSRAPASVLDAVKPAE